MHLVKQRSSWHSSPAAGVGSPFGSILALSLSEKTRQYTCAEDRCRITVQYSKSKQKPCHRHFAS